MLGISPNKEYNITDYDKINKINDIKNKEFKIKKKRCYLQMNDTYLLNPKFQKLGKQALIFNKFTKGKINDKIPVKIIIKY